MLRIMPKLVVQFAPDPNHQLELLAERFPWRGRVTLQNLCPMLHNDDPLTDPSPDAERQPAPEKREPKLPTPTDAPVPQPTDGTVPESWDVQPPDPADPRPTRTP